MYPTQSSGATPQTPARSTTERRQGPTPKGGTGQTATEGAGKDRQARQGQAAGKTEVKRTGAQKALTEYNGKARKHQQSWIRENRGKFKTQADSQAAQQSAWDGSQEGQEAKQTLMLPLTEYNGAVENELRLAADAAGGDAEAIRQAVEKKAAEITARTSGGAEDKILDDVVNRAAPRVAGESPEMRAQALDLAKLVSTRDQAAANLKAIQERRDRDLASVTNPQWRQQIDQGSQAEIQAAQKVLADSEQALAGALKRELSIDVASNALIAAKRALENVGQLPADRQPAARVAAVARVESAQRQFDQVRAGSADVTSFTPEQVDQGVQTVLARHPELMSQQNGPLATELFVRGESLKVRAKIDTNLTTLAANQNTPEWMRRLIATDKVTAAMVTSLGVQNIRPEGSAEEALAKASPLTFAVLKYGSAARFDMPSGTLANPAPTDVLKAGQEEAAKRLKALETSDPRKFAQLQLLMQASGDARVSYIRAEWQRVVAAQTPEQSVEKMLANMLREGDFNNPDYTPPTEIGKFMKTLSVNMLASFTPEQQLEIWNAVGGDVTRYLNRQADHIKARYGEDFALYPASLGEWQKQMGQFAPPPAAGVLVDATIARVDPMLITRPGGGRITQGLQLLGDRAPQSVGKMASWLAGTKELPVRQLLPVQRDGTGSALSQNLLAQYRQNGTDPRVVADMQSLYQASTQNLREERGAQQITEQFKLFNQNRATNLQNIFDSALREGGTLFTQRQNFGNDPATDAVYGQRLGLAPDNPNAAAGQSPYTDAAKLAKIRELKQIDLISRALNLPVDMNALTPRIASGQALPRSENLDQINKLREWVREAGGENAFVTFTPAVYASEKHGVSPLHLIRVEGDKNNDGQITREETTRERPGSWTAETLDDEDVVIDASMLAAATKGQNVPWRYTDFENFRKDNLLDDEGRLYLTNSPDFLLHDADGDGHADNINLNGVDAAITTGWETTRRWGDVVIGVVGLVAGAALIVGTGGLAAPVVAGGAAVYFGARTVETGMEMAGHGQSFNPINTADGAWLGFIDPAAGGLWLGAISSVSGFAALRPLALGRSVVGLGQTATVARGATNAAGLSRNIGTELFLSKGVQTTAYQAQLATVSKTMSWTAQGSGGLMTVGQGQDFVRAAANGEIDWTDWSLHSSTWDFAMMGGGVASFGAGYASAAHARAQARGHNQPPPPPDNNGHVLNILGNGPDSPAGGKGATTPPLLGDGGATPAHGETGQTPPPPPPTQQGEGGGKTPPPPPPPAGQTGGAAPEGGGLKPVANTGETRPTLTAQDVAALKGEGLAALTPDVPPAALAHIDPMEVSHLTPDQIKAFTASQIAALPADALIRMSEAQIQALGKNVSRIAPATFAELAPEQIAALSPQQRGWLSVQQISRLTDAQLRLMTPEQLSSLTAEQRHAISAEQRQGLTEPQRDALDQQIMLTDFGPVPIVVSLQEPVRASAAGKAWHQYTLDEIPTIPGRQIETFTPETLARFSPKQIGAFTQEQQRWFTIDQMAALSARQLAAFKPLQLGAFTPEQRGALKGKQMKLLDDVQKGALTWRWFDGEYGPVSAADLIPHKFNHYVPKTLTGLPMGRISSPLHEVAHLFPGRMIRTLETRSGIEAAARVLQDRQNIMLVTGFSVAEGKPETDGPPGTVLLGRILANSNKGGPKKTITYVTDAANAPILRKALEAIGESPNAVHVFEPPAEGLSADQQAAMLLDKFKPDAVMAIELPGRGVQETPDGNGVRVNMRGVPIDGFNLPLDALVLEANKREGIVTLGVGDGGNEAGMGVVRQLVPLAKDNVTPMAANVPVDHLVTASVSNWGAEAVGVAYATMTGQPELIHTARMQRAAIDASVEAGAVDGVLRVQLPKVDGFSWQAHQGWHILINEAVQQTQMKPIYLALMDSSDGGLYAGRLFATEMSGATGRRVVRVFGLDHGKATYGGQYQAAGAEAVKARGLQPGDPGYDAAFAEAGALRIGELTNPVLSTLSHALEGTASPLVIAMACNTACTGTNYAAGVSGVLDLVRVTGQEMVVSGGRRVVSLSTSGTEGTHAYQRAVVDEVAKHKQERIDALRAKGASQQQIDADPEIARLNQIEIIEIGASANAYTDESGAQQMSPDLAAIVNKMATDNPPAPDEIQRAVDFYVNRIPQDATSVWLTCTHYPALEKFIRKALDNRQMHGTQLVNPMKYQVQAAMALFDIPPAPRPPHLQRSSPPIVVTSGKLTAISADGTSRPVSVQEAERLVASDPTIRIVDDQLTAARTILEREDVRVLHIDDFATTSNPDIGEIRHQIFRANNPADGTLHEYSTWNEQTQKWQAVEVEIRKAEAQAYKDLDIGGETMQPIYENLLRAVAGYGPIEPKPPQAPPPPPPAGGETPPPPPTGGEPPASDGGPPEKPNFIQGLKMTVKEYGPAFAASGILAATVPTEYLVVANGASWVVRGATSLPMAIWPDTFAVGTKAGRAMRAVNALTFIGNGAYHGWTYVDGSGAPMNQLYAISDHGSLAQNVHEARTGKDDGPPKWAKYTTLAAANAANGLLLPFYSIPVGFEAWGPNVLFAGGTAYLTYKALGGGQNHNAAWRRVAAGASAVGLMTFGATYLVRLSDDKKKRAEQAQALNPQIKFDQTGLYDELFTRPIEGSVYAGPLGRAIVIEEDGIPRAIIFENGPLEPAKQDADKAATQRTPLQ